ncbi:MAG: hypothetical protein HY611_03955 [Elusimicrobia bacterium]|nr:hypothetical protein [Elusimicrobiota bacterium]
MPIFLLPAFLALAAVSPQAQIFPRPAEIEYMPIPLWDDRYPQSAWIYLMEFEPDLVQKSQWDKLHPKVQVEMLNTARQKAPEREKEVQRRLVEINGLCGMRKLYDFEKKMKDGRSACDLRPVRQIADSEIAALAIWKGEDPALDIRRRRDRVLRFLAKLENREKFDAQEKAWAAEHLPPRYAPLLDGAGRNTDAARKLAQSLRPDGPLPASARLRISAQDAQLARRIFDGGGSREKPVEGGVRMEPPSRVPARGPKLDVAKDMKRGLMSRLDAPPPMDSKAIRRRVEQFHHDSPEERRLSEAWRAHLKENLKHNSVGRDVLDYVGPDLPHIRLRRVEMMESLTNHTYASYMPGSNSIVVEADKLRAAVGDLGGPTLPEDPREFARYLNRNPKMRERVFKTYNEPMLHELVHAGQDKAFGVTHLRETFKAPTAEDEKHAFGAQLKYMTAGLKDPGYLKETTGLAIVGRVSLESYLMDRDQYNRDIDATYGNTPAKKMLELYDFREKTDREEGGLKPGERLAHARSQAREAHERLDRFYSQFQDAEARRWERDNPEGLAKLAERVAGRDPDKALELLAVAQSRVPQSDVGLRRGMQRTADRAMAKQVKNLREDFRKARRNHEHAYVADSIFALEKRQEQLAGEARFGDLDRMKETSYPIAIEHYKHNLDFKRARVIWPPAEVEDFIRKGSELARARGDRKALAYFEEKKKVWADFYKELDKQEKQPPSTNFAWLDGLKKP